MGLGENIPVVVDRELRARAGIRRLLQRSKADFFLVYPIATAANRSSSVATAANASAHLPDIRVRSRAPLTR
jgi:hypothetical protein